MKKIRVKPSKSQSVVGMLGGIVMVTIGGVIVIPTFGLFGIFWTLIAIIIAGYHAYNVFSSRGAAVWEANIDSNENQELDFDIKIRKLNQLKEDGLITEEEYQKKRNEIMSNEW